MQPQRLDADYWNGRYQKDTAAWDLGRVSPPLKDYIDQVENKNAKLLLPGCGNAWEAEYLLQKGFTKITIIDIAPDLVQSLQQKFKDATQYINIVCNDFFEVEGQFDLVIEQTFFCALPPVSRPSYVKKMYELLKPGGKLVGLLFDRAFEDGPPFGGSKQEYLDLFSPFFEILTMERCYNSIPPRQGTELFIILKRK